MSENIYLLGNGTLASAIRAGYDTFPSSGLAFVDLLPSASIVWCAYDVELSDDHEADPMGTIEALDEVLRSAPRGVVVIVSSQLPVGTCSYLEGQHPRHRFVVVPENIRASHNVQDWMHQPRVICGTRNEHDVALCDFLFRRFTEQIFYVTPESAEMVKHALNGFLACSVAYINEVAYICAMVGADADEVAMGLLTDPRIGRHAYLHPGNPYGGGHLEREINNLIRLGGEMVPLMQAIKASNAVERWERT